MYVCIYIYIYSFIHTYTCLHTCTHEHMHTYAHIHTYIHTYIHTHTHTHTHTHAGGVAIRLRHPLQFVFPAISLALRHPLFPPSLPPRRYLASWHPVTCWHSATNNKRPKKYVVCDSFLFSFSCGLLSCLIRKSAERAPREHACVRACMHACTRSCMCVSTYMHMFVHSFLS